MNIYSEVNLNGSSHIYSEVSLYRIAAPGYNLMHIYLEERPIGHSGIYIWVYMYVGAIYLVSFSIQFLHFGFQLLEPRVWDEMSEIFK